MSLSERDDDDHIVIDVGVVDAGGVNDDHGVDQEEEEAVDDDDVNLVSTDDDDTFIAMHTNIVDDGRVANCMADDADDDYIGTVNAIGVLFLLNLYR